MLMKLLNYTNHGNQEIKGRGKKMYRQHLNEIYLFKALKKVWILVLN